MPIKWTKTEKMTGIYSRYREDLKRASSEELDDITILKKSNHRSGRNIKMCKIIRDLKYLNAILKYKPQNHIETSLDEDDAEDNPCNIDPIMRLLLNRFEGSG